MGFEFEWWRLFTIRVGVSMLLMLGVAAGLTDVGAVERPNVLLICVDDLRPELGCYGAQHMVSPNIDRLAAEGRRFERHYVQAAACGPSRCTLLTGRRESRSWDVWGPARKLASKPARPVSFADLFHRHGYRTVCIGKVSHEPGGTMPKEYRQHQVPFSWDLALGPSGEWKNPWRAFFGYANGKAYNKVIRWTKIEPPRLPFESADVEDHGYPDALIADAAIQQLRDLAGRDEPFLLAVGFYKPHLPHNAPKKYWELYDRDTIGLPSNYHPPKNVDPKICLHQSNELTSHYDWPGGLGNITEEEAINQRHAYFACVSYVDAQIGKVLDEYRRLGLSDKTIVVLWSDHGWHLGEQGIFCKATNFEVATRSPLIVRTPAIASPGQSARGLVETVDVYPTLADLCEIEPPDGLAGASLRPLLADPQHPGKDGALSAFGQGRTLRTERWRIVESRDRKSGAVVQVELYDHVADPRETINVADQHSETVQKLLEILRAQKTTITKPGGHER